MKPPIQIQAKAHLADCLRSLSKLPKHEDGRISWEATKLERGTFELIYSLTFSPRVDDHVKDGALRHVLNECARAKDFSTKFFLRRLRAFVAAHLSRQSKVLIAISQINAIPNAALPSIVPSAFGTIKINPSLSKTDRRVIDNLKQNVQERLGLHSDFLYLSFRVSATDDRSAVDAAYRNIKFMLGVLNLITLGYGVSTRFGFPDAPIGKFLSAAPIFMIDRHARKLGSYLSENHYPTTWQQNFSVWQRNDTNLITRGAKYYISHLARIGFRDRIIQAIILFQEGLETSHIDVALLKFWTGIEVLCAREEREPTERTIERASSIFTDNKHAEMRLNFIQEFRNKIVHRGDVGGHALLCAQWGSIYLAELIQFCLFNRFKLHKREQLLDYLSSPLEETKLADTISLYRKRLAALKERQRRREPGQRDSNST
jgi:hypothetical protein